MKRLGARVNLLICQKSKIQDWVDHFESNYKSVAVFDLTKNKTQIGVFTNWANAQAPAKAANIVCLGVINYELAWRRKELLRLKDFTLMLDESSLIQNRKAKQSKFILKLQPANVILLSGTPTSGKYENLWTQIHLLGWDISEKMYNQHYVNWKIKKIGFHDPKIIHVVDKENPYKNVERLKSKMREHGSVFLKTEDCFELPEQIITKIEVDTSKEYRKFMKSCLVQIGDVELVGDTELTKRLYSRQLCGQYSQAKLDAFRDLLQSTNERIIVFYNFTDEAKAMIHIANDLEKPWGIVNGTEKSLEAYENFGNSVTFVQYQAGAMGLNLQLAHIVIYFTLPDGRQDLFDQSKKRIHRIGQKKACFYYILSCKDSVEDEILKTLDLRKEYTDDLYDMKDGAKNGS